MRKKYLVQYDEKCIIEVSLVNVRKGISLKKVFIGKAEEGEFND